MSVLIFYLVAQGLPSWLYVDLGVAGLRSAFSCGPFLPTRVGVRLYIHVHVHNHDTLVIVIHMSKMCAVVACVSSRTQLRTQRLMETVDVQNILHTDIGGSSKRAVSRSASVIANRQV